MKREPLFRISHRLMKMNPGDRCVYLIACIKSERPDSVRRRELSKELAFARTNQIKAEISRARK